MNELVLGHCVGHEIDVEIGDFADWDAAGRRFDRVTSAQAWHCLDMLVPTAKAAARLTGTSGGFVIVDVRPKGEPARTSCSAQGLPSPELDPASLPVGGAVHRTTHRRRSQGTKPRA